MNRMCICCLFFLLSPIIGADEQEVQKWMQQLTNADPQIRIQAITALGTLGEKVAPAIPALIQAIQNARQREVIQNREREVSLHVLKTLGTMGESLAPEIPNLIKTFVKEYGFYSRDQDQVATLTKIGEKNISSFLALMSDEQPEVRELIAQLLGVIGRNPEQVVPALIKATSDKNFKVRAKAAEALGNFGERAALGIPELITVFNDQNNNKVSTWGGDWYAFNGCYYAAVSLGNIGKLDEYDKVVVPVFIKALSQDNSDMRLIAAIGVETLGEKGTPAVPALIQALRDKKEWWYPRICRHAIQALGAIGQEAAPAVADLISILGDRETYYKIHPKHRDQHPGDVHQLPLSVYAAEALSKIGEPAVPALLKAVNTPDSYVHGEALLALDWMEKRERYTPLVWAALLEMFTKGDEATRLIAIESLGGCGEKAFPYLINALIEEDTEEDSKIRWAAMESLERNGPKVVPYLLKTLENKENITLIKRSMLLVFKITGDDAAPYLMQGLAHPNVEVKIHVVNLLGGMEEKAATAVPSLTQLLSYPQSEVRSTVARVLGKIGKPAAPAISALLHSLSDQEEAVRASAAKAVGEIGEKGESVVPFLCKGLADEGILVRKNTTWALGQFGKAGISAIPAIISKLAEDDVKEQAGETLKQFGKDALPYLEKSLQDPTLAKVHPEIAKIIEEIN